MAGGGAICPEAENMTTNAYRRALYGTIIHVSANVVTLLSICLAMYMSFHYPNDCLTVFCA